MTLTPAERDAVLDYVLTMQAKHGRAGDSPPYTLIDAELAPGGLMSRRPAAAPVLIGAAADPHDTGAPRAARRRPLRCGRYTLRPRIVTAGLLASAGAKLFEARRLSVLTWNVYRFDVDGVDPVGWTRGAE